VDLRFDIFIPKAEVAGQLSDSVLSQLAVAGSPLTIHVPGRILGSLASPSIGLRMQDLKLSKLAAAEFEEYLRLKGVQEATSFVLP
jgi:hypothetical protein